MIKKLNVINSFNCQRAESTKAVVELSAESGHSKSEWLPFAITVRTFLALVYNALYKDV